MKYRVQFQYRPKDSVRPHDYFQSFEEIRDIKADELLLIPNIGDHVDLPADDGYDGDRGIVENRLFSYIILGGETICSINIVITDSDVDWGALEKA